MNLTFTVWLNILVLLGLAVGLVWFAVDQFGTRARVRRRLELAAQGPDTDISAQSAASPRQRMVKFLSALGRRLPIFNTAQRREMRGQLMSAGYRQAGALPVLMGASIAVGLIVVLIVAIVAWPRFGEGATLIKLLSVVVALYLGAMVPRIVLDKLVKRRQLAIANNFPDALDLMVVCANAGLGLNAIILRVAQEIEFLAPELADELSLTAAQMQVSGDTAQVLLEMADRIGMDSVRSLASTLNQSRQYGTPISEALRVLASSERTARRMRTEEAAGKLATKMTLPMMIFILPTVLLIVGGPAVLGLMKSFSTMAN